MTEATATGGSDVGMTDEALLEFYGPEFITYALGGNALAEVDLSTPVFLIARRMLASISQMPASEPTALNRRIRALWMLCSPHGEVTLAQHLHVSCGGSIAPVASDDPLISTLTTLAASTFPVLSIPRADGHPIAGSIGDISTVIHANPVYRRCVEEFRNDEAISKLLVQRGGGAPDSDQSIYGTHIEGIWSDGSAGGVQLAMLPSSALEFARLLTHIYPTTDVERAVADTVEAMRSIAARRRAQVPAIIQLGSVRLPPATTVQLEHATLKSADGLLESIPTIGIETTGVLVIETELALLDTPGPDDNIDGMPDSWPYRKMRHFQARFEASRRWLEREIVRARLAVALASPEGDEQAPTAGFRLILNPFQTSGWYGPLQSPAPSVIREIDPGAHDSVAEWHRRLGNLPESMWLGARRLVGAIADRFDPLDAFVDAVVCWENLFGSEMEVSFRLCAAMAWVLEPDEPSARQTLFSELRELYGVRSGLVHGSREPAPGRAHEYRSRAISLGVASMRNVLDRADLLEAKNAGERNRLVLMGA